MNELLLSVRRALRLSSLELEPHLDAGAPGPLRAAAVTALLGLYLMAVGMGGFKALENSGMALMVLGSLPFLRGIASRLRQHPVAWFVLAFFAYLLVRTAGAAWDPDPPGVEHWDRAYRMSRVLLIPLVAWWLGGRTRRIYVVLLCVLVGLVLAVLERWIEWGSVLPMFSDHRAQFRLNPQRMGLFSGIAALGLLVLWRPFFLALGQRLGYVTTFLAWLLLVVLMLQAAIVTQSRGAYAALLVGVAALVILTLWRAPRHSFQFTILRPGIPAVVVAVVAITLAAQWDTIVQRTAAEQEVIGQVLTGNLEDLRTSPIGVRVYLLRGGIEAWLQKPWLGWGTDGAVQVILEMEGPDMLERFNHFHNTYLDLAVRFGLIGAAIFLAIPVLLLLATLQSMATGRLDPFLGRFLVTTLAIFAVANLSETHIVPSHGWFFLALLGGAMYTHRLWESDSPHGSREPLWKMSLQ